MKNIKLFSLCFTVVLFLCYPKFAHAAPSSNVVVTIRNDLTNQLTIINQKSTFSTVNSASQRANTSKNIDENFSIFIPTELLTDNLRATSSGSQTSGGVTANLSVNYDISSNNQQIRVNTLSGSWKPSSQIYTLSNRSANVHSGAGTGYTLNRNPTRNSFFYNTHWGYNNRIRGDARPRAWSNARVNVSGMSATHTISIDFSFS